MKSKALLLALALVVAVNAFVLAGVAYNRSGTPHGRLTLTARELPVAWDFGGSGENSGLALRIEWQHEDGIERDVFTPEKLQALGFEWPQTPWDWEHHKQQLDRKAYAVFEYDGAAWAAVLRARQAALEKSLATAQNDADRQRLQQGYAHFERAASRLVLVDVGRDAGALRARYTDATKYLIAKAKVSVYAYHGPQPTMDYTLRGHVAALLPGEVNVARDFQRGVAPPDVPRRYPWRGGLGDAPLPNYLVTLVYGQRDEPWVEAVSNTASVR